MIRPPAAPSSATVRFGDLGSAVRFARFGSKSLFVAAMFIAVGLLGDEADAQPAAPPAPHVEPIGTHDLASDSVGATPGDFRVDEGGGASYSIPIVSLPGTAGLTPKFSLDYGSRGGVGALGTGFVLSGQSAFSRCKGTVEAGDGPGPHPGVDFSDNDNVAICLDGQRLFSVADENGCPGLADIPFQGRPFRTELDPATRICGYSKSSGEGESDFWLVFPKDGTMRRYGYVEGSALRPNDGTGVALEAGYQAQALDRIADPLGNTVDFAYTANVATGEMLLTEAKYTGKVADRFTMAAAYTRQPYARTTMVYEAMPGEGQRVDYFGGSRMSLTQRLKEINVFGPTNHGANPNLEVRARTYRLSYGLAPTGSRMPRLIAAHECAPNPGGGSDVCYPPTRFAWNNDTDNDFPQGYFAPGTAGSYSNLLNFAVDFKIGDVDGDGRQDLVYIKDRNCPGNPVGERDPVAGSAFRFRFMVALGNETGLDVSSNADVFPRRTPPTGVSIPTCEDNGPATNFDANEAIRWDLIWHLFDLTGDGRDDLIAQVPDFGTCATCYRWKVFAAVPANGRWTFTATGVDLGIASERDQDSNFVDLTGDGLPELLFGNPAGGLSVRALRRVTGAANLAYEFETSDRTVSFAGFEPDVTLSFGTVERSALRAGDLNGDGVADLVLHASKVRAGVQCNGGTCSACGGSGEPVCEEDLLSACPTGATSCIVPIPPPLPTSSLPRWQNASSVSSMPDSRQILIHAKYWVTAKVTPVGNNFVVNAGQCIGGGVNAAFCDTTIGSLLSASLADLNGDGLADVLMRYRVSGSDSNRIDRFAYRLNRGGNNLANALLPEASTGLVLKRREADRLQLADLTGDKRADLVYQINCAFPSPCTSGANPLKFRRYTGAGYGVEEEAANGSPAVLGGQNPDRWLVLPMDINGDGTAELVRYKADNSTSQNLYVVQSNLRYGGNDFIVKFVNGLGATHQVIFAPLVNRFVYERAFDGPRKDYGRSSPVFDVFSPLWAVREARSSSPGCPSDAAVCIQAPANLTATSVVRYSYQGARVQTGGRGFLGFQAIRTEDIQNKLLTTTEYRQDYPFIGRPSRTIVQTLAGVIEDPCLLDPLNPTCFEEPPEECGPLICQAVPPLAPKTGRASVNPRFMTLVDPVISDFASDYGSKPAFVPAAQVPISVYSHSSTETRIDLATQAQTQRINTTMDVDVMGNLTAQESITLDQDGTEVERKGQVNFYGCTETPVVLVKGLGCETTGKPDAERVRLGRLSLTGVYSIRGGVIAVRRSTFEYDSASLLLIAEVSGLYDPTEPEYADRDRLHQRTDYVLDANGNRTLSVSCSAFHFPDRTACLDLSAFLHAQWPATPTKFQRYGRVEYDSLGRFAQGSKSPYRSASNTAGTEAYNERSGVDAAGALNRTVFGDPLGVLTAHGVYAEKAYGPFGREYFARAAPGAFGRTTYAWCVDAQGTTLPDGSGGIPPSATRVNCPVGAVYRVENNSSEGALNTAAIAPRSFAYFDVLGRQILTTTRLYQSNETDPTQISRWTSSYTRFDVLGRKRTASEPYISLDPLASQTTHRAGAPQSGATPAETRTQYDVLSRGTAVEIPSESYNGITVSSAEFDRMRTVSFNPRSFDTTIDKNGLAETKLAIDHDGLNVNMRHAVFGNVDQVTRTPTNGSSANETITTTLSFDVLGRKTQITDPDKGTLTYSYNALGELLTQVDAKGQTQSLFYDALGRLIERRENRRTAPGAYVEEPTATWRYDDALLVGTSTKAVGLLIEQSNGMASKQFAYDSFGRGASVTTNLEGTLYYQRTTYDKYGRVFQSFDASTSSTSPNGQLQVYSGDGYPIGVREAAHGLVGIVYSEVLALTARQQVRRERYHESASLVSERTFDDNSGRLATISTGIGGSLQRWDYRWDENGNLTKRRDQTNGADWEEEFDYDALDRLTTVTQTRAVGIPTAVETLTLAYDQLGNITQKTGVGAANLGAFAYKSTTAQTGCARVAGPHAVSQINGKNYCYDENGNNTEVRKNGSVIRTITYTGFDLAEQIVRNEITDEGLIQAQVSFKYDAGRAMYKRVDGNAGAGNNCGVPDGVFCSRFEDSDIPPPPSTASKTTFYVDNVEFIREGITDKVKRYVGSYLVITTVQANPPVYDYLLRDSLGSIDTIASETGVMKSRQSFNAHGQRRNAATASMGSWGVLSLFTAALFDSSTTTQGYTGHQQLDPVGLVHMRARLFDPEIGRFLQADDYIEADATQGLNRYSYVLNNPLTATDPTGNFSLRQALAIVIGVVAAIISQQYWILNNLWASFATAVAGGFASAYIATGSLKAGLWGALSAAVFWGIGTAFSKTVVYQKSPDNLVEVIVRRESAGTGVAKIAAHAAAGGTLNRLQGGKFGHGFISAGFTEALSPAIGQIGDGKSFASILGRTAASAAIGGTASELSGGRFANGARTAAFQQLFNETVHEGFFQEAGRSVGNVLQDYGSSFNNWITSPTVVDSIAGLGDGASFGISSGIREAFDIGDVDTTSSEYLASRLTGSILAPTARLGYIVSVGRLRFLSATPANAIIASSTRNSLKWYFRGQFARFFRDYKPFSSVVQRYGPDSAAIIAASSRTNMYFNNLALTGAGAAIVQYDRGY